MHFFANEALDAANGDDAVWTVLREAAAASDGVAYYHYPLFSGRGAQRREPGIVMAQRGLGLVVVDVLGCDLASIGRIEGDTWSLSGRPRAVERPLVVLDDHLHELRALVEREHELRRRLAFSGFVALPRIRREEWEARFGVRPTTLLFQDDMHAGSLRLHLIRQLASDSPALDDPTWALLLGALRGRVREHDRWTADATTAAGPLEVIRAVEGHVRFLDEQQDRVACEIPEGPQRIRGLAGSGKTVLLCRRAAFMHAKYPDWHIALVFFSRGLYQAVTDLVADRFRGLTAGDEINPKRLRILHAWGGREQHGFYRELCEAWRKPPLGFTEAQRLASRQGEEFTAVCADLESRLDSGCKPVFDAVLIDEGQDLPPEFYRLAHRSLRDPKRLTWAYDEAQGIGSLVVPASAEVFGRAADGTPLVDIGALGPRYPSGIAKAHNLNRCYRTPANALVTAHAVNMGLLRSGGPLQGVSTVREWLALGYAVLEGSFSKSAVAEGTEVVIARDRTRSGHPVDQPGLNVGIEPRQTLEVVPWARTWDQTRALTSRIKSDLDAGMKPEDILVVPINIGPSMTSATFDLRGALESAGIPSVIVGEGKVGADVFRSPGHVTIAHVFRAKGNEAWKVYACNLHLAGSDVTRDPDDELRLRNAALVGLTRSRLFTVALGQKGSFMRELAAAAATAPRLKFRAFNAESLRRAQDVGAGLEG